MLEITIVTLRSDISESAGATKTPEEAAEESTEASGADENGDEKISLYFLVLLLLFASKLLKIKLIPYPSCFFLIFLFTI